MLLVVRDDQAEVQYSNIGRTYVINALVRIVEFFDVKLLRIRRARACAL